MSRLIYLALVIVLLIPFGADWALATASLSQIDIESSLNEPQVIADGKNSIQITVHVTQDGAPRVNDTLQLWLDVGGGVLPEWAFTDAQGQAVIKFSPNPKTAYDTTDTAVVHVSDTSIGHLVEVDKDTTVAVPLVEPTEEQHSSIFG